MSTNVQWAVLEWMPNEMVTQIYSIVADFLWSCMRNNQFDQNFDHLCLNTLKSFAFDEISIRRITDAMLDEQWLLKIDGKLAPVQLNFRQKVTFVKLLSGSSFISEDELAQV